MKLLLKSMLYYFILVTTAVRFADMVFLLTKDSTNLPMTVVAVTSAMIIYGIVLVVKKIIGNVNLRQLMLFFIIQAAMILFNITFTSLTSPLRYGLAETFIVGSFLDVIVDGFMIYLSVRSIKSAHKPIIKVASVKEIKI